MAEMGRILTSCFVAALMGLVSPAGRLEAQVPSPSEFLGREVGADRYLAPYEDVTAYFHALDAASPRVKVEVAGQSTLDNDLLVVVLTSEENQARLDHYREIARRLAHPYDLSPQEARSLIDEGRTIVLVSCTIHSTEVGATQMSMEFAHRIATTEDPEERAWIEDVIFLLMPSINPDGQVLVIDWYNRNLGTEYEGGPMPWLYHHYVGHDDNRDFYMLTQKETRIVNDVLYHRWYPQVFLDEHQMGSTGPRMFVPPQTDPLAPEVHSLIFRQADLLGTAMALRLEENGKTGVGSNMIYDAYWPGGTRNTAWWKNVTGLLTEVASARIATPIYIEAGELQGGRKGLPKYQRRANFPSPWKGGWWRLRDILDYEMIATMSLLESASRYRRDILTNLYRMASQAIEEGRSDPPYAFLVPPEQHDPVAAARLIELLLRHGVVVHSLEQDLTLGRALFSAGTYVIPAAQPYRAFLLTMLRPQRYPEVIPHRGGPILPPYDVASWSLPIAMGVEVEEAREPVEAETVKLDAPLWPGGPLEPAAGGYLISRRADSAFRAINRLLQKKNRKLYALPGSEASAGVAPGDFFLPPKSVPLAELSRLSQELHVPVQGLGSPPTGDAYRVRPITVGLYKPWVASMDEGWTRFVLESYEFAVQTLHNDDLRSGKFKDSVDVVLLPDVDADVLRQGQSSPDERSPYPSEYSGGIGTEGGSALADWVRKGGTAVALDSSGEYLIDLLDLPVEDVLADSGRPELVCPGSMLRIHVDTRHPLGYGLRPEEAAYFANSPAFRTRVPDSRFRRRVVARYPDDEKDILVSGYLKGGERLERRAAVVEVEVDRGRVVLLGFRAQHRAQPHRTFKFLFNALYRAAQDPVSLGGSPPSP